MKKKSLIRYASFLTASVFSLTYFFLIPLARIEVTQAQGVDVPQPTRVAAGEKRTSKTHIPTGASSTYMKTSDGEEHLLIQDHITSTRIVESNKDAQLQEYYPYGMNNGEPTTHTDKQFTSHRSLTDTGVYHAGARFYNPQLGIFVSADKVQGPNRYMYAAANPTIYTDPSGKIIPLVIAAIIIGGGAFGAGFGAGYEQGSQVAQYGSVQEPSRVVGAGIVGGVAGASVGYLGAVAAPAAIGAMSAGAGATSSVGIIGGAQIGAGACMTNPHCMNAVEAGAQLATGADLPPSYGVGLPDGIQPQRLRPLPNDLREFSTPLIGREITLYKGLPGGWDEGDIMPAGWYSNPASDYPNGQLRRTFASDEILTDWVHEHALTGQTGTSKFSSWTPFPEYAQVYAGSQGCIVQCRFDVGEVMDLQNFYRTPSMYNDGFNFVAGQYGLGIESYPGQVFQANVGRILENGDEYLHFGVVSGDRIEKVGGFSSN